MDDKSTMLNKEQKLDIMCFIVDKTLFANLDLLSYINTSVIREIY